MPNPGGNGNPNPTPGGNGKLTPAPGGDGNPNSQSSSGKNLDYSKTSRQVPRFQIKS